MRKIGKKIDGISKTKNLLDNTPDQQFKFRTKNWVETNNDSRGMYNTNRYIKLRASVLKSSLCNYSDLYILVKGTISVVNVVLNQVTQMKTIKK